jgi:phosphoglycerate dehydrogenase-like enzyme
MAAHRRSGWWPRCSPSTGIFGCSTTDSQKGSGGGRTPLGDGTVVVNVGRGGSVDTDALLAELTSGRLRAALDVTDPEPLPVGHPLWSAPGLLLTPHVAGSTAGAWARAWAVAMHQIEVFASGERPPNLVAGS